MEQTISRSEVGFSSESPVGSPDPDDFARVRASATEFEYVAPQQTQETEQDDEDEQMDFQLFAPTAAVKSDIAPEPMQKIRLRSVTPPDPENAGFVIPNRPSVYYFASSTPQSELRSVALSGEDVVRLSRTSCPGNQYPWKVLHVPASGLSRAVKAQEAATFQTLVGKTGPRKCRPGKKIRIAMRTKASAAKKQAEEKAKEAEEKEAREREKRSSRNREKKLKRREKERAKKAEARAANGEALPEGKDGAESSDDG